MKAEITLDWEDNRTKMRRKWRGNQVLLAISVVALVFFTGASVYYMEDVAYVMAVLSAVMVLGSLYVISG